MISKKNRKRKHRKTLKVQKGGQPMQSYLVGYNLPKEIIESIPNDYEGYLKKITPYPELYGGSTRKTGLMCELKPVVIIDEKDNEYLFNTIYNCSEYIDRYSIIFLQNLSEIIRGITTNEADPFVVSHDKPCLLTNADSISWIRALPAYRGLSTESFDDGEVSLYNFKHIFYVHGVNINQSSSTHKLIEDYQNINRLKIILNYPMVLEDELPEEEKEQTKLEIIRLQNKWIQETNEYLEGCPSLKNTPKTCIDDRDYRQQSLTYHPDKNRACPTEAAEKFNKLQRICKK